MWLAITMVCGFVGFSYLYLNYVICDFLGIDAEDLEK